MLTNQNDTFFKRNNYLLLTAAWLLTIAFIVSNYWSVTSTPQAIQKSIQRELANEQRKADRFLNDTATINKLKSGKYDEDFLASIIKKTFYVFVYTEDTAGHPREIFWSTQDAAPDSHLIVSHRPKEFTRLNNGWFLSLQKSYVGANGSGSKIICLIPVKWDYYIQNKYLKNDFAGLRNIADAYGISEVASSLPIRDIQGDALFYLEKTGNLPVHNINYVALILGIIALLLILFFIHLLANYISENFGFFRGLAVLVGLLIIIRFVTYELDPYHFRQLMLFSPSVYKQNFLMGSLGDLLVNSVLFVWVILFIRFHLRNSFSPNKQWSKVRRYAIAFAIASLMVGITFLSGNIILSLIADQQISFDVINFFSLNIYSVIGFIVLTCVATGYFFLVQLLMQVLRSMMPKMKLLRYLFIATAGLCILTLTSNIHTTFRIFLLLWLLLLVILLEFKILLLHAYRLVSSRFIFWAFFFSVSITAVIVVQNRAKELDARKKFAENLSNKADPSGPVIMSIILTDFRNEYLTKIFRRFKDPLQSLLLKDSLVNESFSGYLNKYNTDIFTFDSSGNPLFNLRPATFNELNTIIQTQGKETGVPGLYYYDVSYSNFNYISKKTITDSSGGTQGYLFIVSKPKKFKSETLYPELFSRGNKNALESSSEYAFAIYNNGKLITSYNDYPFSTHISTQAFTHNGFKTISHGEYEELWYRVQPNKIIVITRQDRFFLEAVTLFAYLFCSFLVITLFFNLVGHFISDKKKRDDYIPFWRLTIRNQVLGTIILISLLSFVVIGISTILFFINRYHNNNREFLSRTIHVMENELHNTMDSTNIHSLSESDLENIPDQKLSAIINNVSNIHATDINLYDLRGNLKVSSLPLPYEKGILSEKMDPIAWYHLSVLKEAQFFQEQNIGSLQYLSNYLPVRDENGKEYAYLNIPYFESQKKLQDEISNFLVAIINLNAFIFLMAGIIALYITNKITRSFSLISAKMKQVNLQTGNEEIKWSRNDEIGELVDEYNRMVRQLEVSAAKLARSEREGAWREMARQVAHEIKNPLTPMKLNLQYLQMAIDKNNPDVKNISMYVAKIILEQIDHLSSIASDFAQFANISNTKMQTFDLNEILKNVISLYATNEKVEIKAQCNGTLLIHADKTQINRLFTNLLQNAVQSVPEFRDIKIEISSQEENEKAIVSVKDNGVGIQESLRSKIFMPNFTTKSSGTGLGLAMCKGIVDKIEGEIWFDTKEGEWTVFHVSIPIAKPGNEDLPAGK